MAPLPPKPAREAIEEQLRQDWPRSGCRAGAGCDCSTKASSSRFAEPSRPALWPRGWRAPRSSGCKCASRSRPPLPGHQDGAQALRGSRGLDPVYARVARAARRHDGM